jgi:formylglycine-generating enzyme required for sulfatase activity
MGTSPWTGQANVLNNAASAAIYISWEDALAFVAALNTHTGLNFKLPSEAQWEYACRAGTTTRFYWGADLTEPFIIGNYAWYWGNSSTQSYARIVGGKLANAWSFFDMSGNAHEWVQDWYAAYPSGPVNNPTGPETGTNKVYRGGSWGNFNTRCRSSSRLNALPTYKDSLIGFRVAR